MYVQICISLIKSRNPRMVVKNCPFVSSYESKKRSKIFSYYYYYKLLLLLLLVLLFSGDEKLFSNLWQRKKIHFLI